jgi:hypothetical protein
MFKVNMHPDRVSAVPRNTNNRAYAIVWGCKQLPLTGLRLLAQRVDELKLEE